MYRQAHATARRHYGDAVRRVLRDEYEAPGVANATTRRLKPDVDRGWRLGYSPAETADRIARRELDTTIIREES